MRLIRTRVEQVSSLKKAPFTAEGAESAENLREKLSGLCVLRGEKKLFAEKCARRISK
jgi:hypothetical protein